MTIGRRKRYATTYTLTDSGWAEWRRRRKTHALIGPVPCQACRVPLYWRSAGWCEAGVVTRHRCA